MGIDVSYIGNIDLNVYSSSSPGLNGLIFGSLKISLIARISYVYI